MNKKLTVLSVIIAHLGVITGLVFIAGCNSRSGYEGQHNLSAFNGKAGRSTGGFGGPGDIGVSSIDSGRSSAPAPAPTAVAAQPEVVVNPPSAAEAPSSAYTGAAAEPTFATNEVAPEPAVVAVKETKTTAEPVGAGKTYIVKKNDSFWLIAKREGVTTDELVAANGLSKNAVIKEGQKLVIPASSGRKVVAKETKPAVAVSGETYLVKSGDSISVIARRLGTTSANLRAANGLTNDNIRAGQTLKVPADARNKSASAPAPTAKAATPAKAATKTAVAPAPTVKTSTAKAAPGTPAAPASTGGLRDLPAFGTPADEPASAPAPAPAPASGAAPMPEAVDATAVGI